MLKKNIKFLWKGLLLATSLTAVGSTHSEEFKGDNNRKPLSIITTFGTVIFDSPLAPSDNMVSAESITISPNLALMETQFLLPPSNANFYNQLIDVRFFHSPHDPERSWFSYISCRPK